MPRRLALTTLAALALAACASTSTTPEPPGVEPVPTATPPEPGYTDAPPPVDEIASPPAAVMPPPALEGYPAGSRQRGESCVDGRDCASGLCQGVGCGTPDGVCVDQTRTCRKDLRTYCGCDGETFRGSSNCQNRRWAHPGPCRAPVPMVPAPEG